jgi:hypothetical protein
MLVSSLISSRRSAARVGSAIANSMRAPIRMAPLPAVKASEDDRITDQPGSTRSQVIVIASHHSHVFDSIPDIGVRHPDRHLGHGWRYVHHGRCDGDRATGGQRHNAS